MMAGAERIAESLPALIRNRGDGLGVTLRSGKAFPLVRTVTYAGAELGKVRVWYDLYSGVQDSEGTAVASTIAFVLPQESVEGWIRDECLAVWQAAGAKLVEDRKRAEARAAAEEAERAAAKAALDAASDKLRSKRKAKWEKKNEKLVSAAERERLKMRSVFSVALDEMAEKEASARGIEVEMGRRVNEARVKAESESESRKEPPKELSSLTVPQLKEMLRERGLKVGGRKAELIERLSE